MGSAWVTRAGIRFDTHSLEMGSYHYRKSADSEVTVLLGLWIQVESGVEPLAHDEALLDLDVDLLPLQWLQEDEGDGEVEADDLAPDWEETGLHGVGEVALADELSVGPGVEASSEHGGLPKTLSVVETVDNGEVLLPLVCVHACLK